MGGTLRALWHDGSVPRNIDYSPLTDPVTKDEVAAYKARAKAAESEWTTQKTLRVVFIAVIAIVIVVVGIPILSTAITLLGLIFANLTGYGEGTVNWGSLAFVLVAGAVIVGGILVTVRTLPKFLGRWERRMRLDRFAQANALLYTPRTPDPRYPGMIFGLGHDRVASDHMRSTSGRFLDFGNYQYVTGSGKESTTHNWGYLALELDRQLPNMMLDAKSNNSFFGTNLPSTLRKNQVLSLEGDFDKYFTLYCPQEYERDALYVFTPDLMALLIDETSAFDVEIVDNWMFVYSAQPLDVAKVDIVSRLIRIVDTVGAKTLSQTERYRDERVAVPTANAVAPQGRRLKRGVSVTAIIVFGGILLFNIVRIVSDFPR